jgi:hypothetical protein
MKILGGNAKIGDKVWVCANWYHPVLYKGVIVQQPDNGQPNDVLTITIRECKSNLFVMPCKVAVYTEKGKKLLLQEIEKNIMRDLRYHANTMTAIFKALHECRKQLDYPDDEK